MRLLKKHPRTRRRRRSRTSSWLNRVLSIIKYLGLLGLCVAMILMTTLVLKRVVQLISAAQSPTVQLTVQQVSSIHQLQLILGPSEPRLKFFVEENQTDSLAMVVTEYPLSDFQIKKRKGVQYPYLQVTCSNGQPTCTMEEAETLILFLNEADEWDIHIES